MLRIAVLALQGAYREHILALKREGIYGFELKLPHQLEEADGLIMPGGESTAIYRLMEKYGFEDQLGCFFKAGKPIWGTCAGMVLLADKDTGMGLGYMDITVKRNAYGRQIDSFEETIKTDLGGAKKEFRAIFIRAPKILRTGKNVQVLGSLNGEAVMAREVNVLACSFHPELGPDPGIHDYFIEMVKNNKGEN